MVNGILLNFQHQCHCNHRDIIRNDMYKLNRVISFRIRKFVSRSWCYEINDALFSTRLVPDGIYFLCSEESKFGGEEEAI